MFFDLQLFALLPSDGVDFLLKINTGTESDPIWTTLGGQRGATMKFQADEIDASDKTSGGWKSTIPGLRSWGIEADALILTDDSGTDTDAGYVKLQDCYLNRTKVQVQYVRKDGTIWQGFATITDLSEEAPHDDVATYKVTLSGIGAPTKVQGVCQVETATIVAPNGITTAGDASIVVTKNGMMGSPITLAVPVAEGDSAAVVAQRVREAMAANANIAAKMSIGGTGANVVATLLTAEANDPTFNISSDNDTCEGLTPMPASENTRAGVAPPA